MTDAKSAGQVHGEAGQVIDEVLEAEAEAARAVAECEQRAEKIVTAAQARAQRLIGRADQRITAIELNCNHRIDSMIRAIEQQQQLPDGSAHPAELAEQTIKAVVAELAAELTARDRDGGD